MPVRQVEQRVIARHLLDTAAPSFTAATPGPTPISQPWFSSRWRSAASFIRNST